MSALDDIREVAALTRRTASPQVVTGVLHSMTGSMATVSLWDGEPSVVPAIPGVYDGITTVHVHVDERGRPVLVAGPSAPAPAGAPPPSPDPAPPPPPPGQATRTGAVSPTFTGTYRTSGFAGWGKWGESTNGYPYTLMQGSRHSSGTLLGCAVYGSQVSGLGASLIESMVVTVRSTHWEPFIPVLRPAPHRSRPENGPTPEGPSVNVGTVAPGGSVKVALSAEVREGFRTGQWASLVLVGSDHGAVRGRDTATGMVLSLGYRVPT